MKKVIGSMVLIMLVFLLVACGDDSGSKGGNEEQVLKIATSAEYPPFESYDSSGEMVGFDIDLAHLIGEELGRGIKMEDMKFDGLIGALQSGRVDMVLAGMSADEERKQNVDFSVEYNESDEMFISKLDDPLGDIDSLDGKTIGVQLGSIQEEGAKRLQEEYDFEIKKIDTAPLMIQELVSNRIDAVYMDKDAALGFIESQGLYGFDNPKRSSPGMAVAFPQGSDLVTDVNKAIETLEENGEIQKLRDKWLSK